MQNIWEDLDINNIQWLVDAFNQFTVDTAPENTGNVEIKDKRRTTG